MKYYFYLCVVLVGQEALGMQCKGIHLHPRQPARGASAQAERIFEFNQHDLQCRTQESAGLPEMRSLVQAQLLLSFAIAERTSFFHDIDFFLTDWQEEFCSRPECRLAHLCKHELAVLDRFGERYQRAFFSRAIASGLLPEKCDFNTFCASPRNRLWLFQECYHFFYAHCNCRSIFSLFFHAKAEGLVAKQVTYAQFCAGDQLQSQRSALLHKVCNDKQLPKSALTALSHKESSDVPCHRACEHEKACIFDCGNACAGRGIPLFLSLLRRINNSVDAEFLGSCAHEVNAFLSGLASPTLPEDEQLADSPLNSPGSLTLSPDSSAPPRPVGHDRLALLKSVLHQNWQMLGTLFSFSWQEFKADDDHAELKTEEEEGGWYTGTASPATQMAQLVAHEELRKKKELKELSDVVATTNPPTRIFYYQCSLTETQKKISDDIIRMCVSRMVTSPFKGTMHRDAQARILGLFDRVIVRQCAQTCLRCLQEKEQTAREVAREQAGLEALLAWMAKQEALPTLSRKKEIGLRCLTEK